jgi:hypothetical protein
MADELGATQKVADAVHKTLGDLVERGAGDAFMPEQVRLLRSPQA